MIKRGRAIAYAAQACLRFRAWPVPGPSRRWWLRSPPARDCGPARLGDDAVMLFGAYGEAHPSTERLLQGGHHLPHTPTRRALLVAVGGPALAWRRR